jgi:hypothetical protein
MSSYAIRYWRSPEVSAAYEEHGVFKPAGWVTSPHKYEDRQLALKHIDHINRLGPEYPCELAVYRCGI